jgi:hypothetical protein
MAYGTVVADQIQTSVSNASLGAGNATAFKNRIINGACNINQYGAGNTVTVTNTSGLTYFIDRFWGFGTQASKLRVAQTGFTASTFTNGIQAYTLSAATVGTSDNFAVGQNIEGLNVIDLLWGTANARTITISFWAQSSITGTFGGAIRNGSANRSYPFSYSLPVANTPTFISITIPGDTTGTWATDNSNGMFVQFSMGTGSTLSNTAGSWYSGNYAGATGAVQVIANASATWYITGLQFEVGSVATGFDYRSYVNETSLCYRYYYRSTQYSTYSPIGVGRAFNTTNGNAPFYLPVPMRGNQTITYSALTDFDLVTAGHPSDLHNDGAGPSNVKVGWTYASVTSGNLYQLEFTNTTSGWLAFSAEL